MLEILLVEYYLLSLFVIDWVVHLLLCGVLLSVFSWRGVSGRSLERLALAASLLHCMCCVFFFLEIRVLRWVMTRAVLESSSSSWWVVVYVRCIVRLKKLNTILLRWHPKFFCFTCWRKEWVLVLKEWFFWSWKERSDVYYEGGSSKMMWCCREGGPLAHD